MIERRDQSFEPANIERYRRRESSIEGDRFDGLVRKRAGPVRNETSRCS